MHNVKVIVEYGTEIDLRESVVSQVTKIPLKGTDKVFGAAVFDDNGRLLPLISEYLSWATKTQDLSTNSALTYGRNLAYFLGYLQSRRGFSENESDEAFLTVQKHVIQEYFSHLEKEQELSSKTIRNRDACLRAFVSDYLCQPQGDKLALREDDPWLGKFLSKSPKNSKIESCSFEELEALIRSSYSERERTLIQFLFDSGLRRSELPRVTLADINAAIKFNSEEFVASEHANPVTPQYSPLFVKGSKGRANQIKPRWTLVSKPTLMRIRKYHSSPLYKRHSRKYTDPDSTPAFFNAQGLPFSAKSISKLVERLSKRAITNGALSKSISPHKLRHGNAYAILQSEDLGVDFLDRLVIVQKNFGHNQLSTTEMYTSIPQDLYNKMCDEHGQIMTRAQKMSYLLANTQLKIRLTQDR